MSRVNEWIEFDGKRVWSFGNDYARIAIIFSVDNSSSSHADNYKNNVLMLSDRDGSPEKSLVLILIKQKQTFAWF